MDQPRSEVATLAGGCFWCLEAVFDEVKGVHDVTEVAPFTAFYPAEDYHQEYFRRNPSQPYCRMIVAPKVAKVRKQYRARLKEAGSA